MNAGLWDPASGIFDVVTRESKQQYLNILNLLQEVTLKGESKVPSYILSCCVYKLPSAESLSASVPSENSTTSNVFGLDPKSIIGDGKPFIGKLRGRLENLRNFNFIELIKRVGTIIATNIKALGKIIFQGGSLKEYFLLPEVNSLFTEEQQNVIRQYIKLHKCASGNDLNEALSSKNVIMIDDQALYPAYMLRQLQDRGCAIHTVSLQNQGL